MPENTKGYPCKDCKRTFETVKDFSNHFERELTAKVEGKGAVAEGVGMIVGCKDVDKGE